jgi:hypothetical protein
VRSRRRSRRRCVFFRFSSLECRAYPFSPLQEPERKKTHAEIMEEVVAKAKHYKVRSIFSPLLHILTDTLSCRPNANAPSPTTR